MDRLPAHPLLHPGLQITRRGWSGELTLSLADRDGDGRMGHRAMIEGIGHRALGMLRLQFLLQVGAECAAGATGLARLTARFERVCVSFQGIVPLNRSTGMTENVLWACLVVVIVDTFAR